MLKFIDGKTLTRRKAEESAFVRLPVNEVPGVWVPVVASRCVVPQGGAKGGQSDEVLKVTSDCGVAKD